MTTKSSSSTTSTAKTEAAAQLTNALLASPATKLAIKGNDNRLLADVIDNFAEQEVARLNELGTLLDSSGCNEPEVSFAIGNMLLSMLYCLILKQAREGLGAVALLLGSNIHKSARTLGPKILEEMKRLADLEEDK